MLAWGNRSNTYNVQKNTSIFQKVIAVAALTALGPVVHIESIAIFPGGGYESYHFNGELGSGPIGCAAKL